MNRRETIPWLVVAIITLVALIIAIFIVGVARLNNAASPTGSASALQSTSMSSTAATDTSTSTSASAAASAPTATGTSNLPIKAWKVQVSVPKELGYPSFTLSSNTLTFSTPLEKALPSECSGLEGSWGIVRSTKSSDDAGARVVNGKTYTFFSPNETCPADSAAVDKLTTLYQQAFDSLSATAK